MSENLEPYPVGTLVTRVSDGKRYVITAHDHPENMFHTRELVQMLDEGMTLADSYPDGVAYQIFPEGMERKFGLIRDYTVWRVRRGSITPVEGS